MRLTTYTAGRTSTSCTSRRRITLTSAPIRRCARAAISLHIPHRSATSTRSAASTTRRRTTCSARGRRNSPVRHRARRLRRPLARVALRAVRPEGGWTGTAATLTTSSGWQGEVATGFFFSPMSVARRRLPPVHNHHTVLHRDGYAKVHGAGYLEGALFKVQATSSASRRRAASAASSTCCPTGAAWRACRNARRPRHARGAALPAQRRSPRRRAADDLLPRGGARRRCGARRRRRHRRRRRALHRVLRRRHEGPQRVPIPDVCDPAAAVRGDVDLRHDAPRRRAGDEPAARPFQPPRPHPRLRGHRRRRRPRRRRLHRRHPRRRALCARAPRHERRRCEAESDRATRRRRRPRAPRVRVGYPWSGATAAPAERRRAGVRPHAADRAAPQRRRVAVPELGILGGHAAHRCVLLAQHWRH